MYVSVICLSSIYISISRYKMCLLWVIYIDIDIELYIFIYEIYMSATFVTQSVSSFTPSGYIYPTAQLFGFLITLYIRETLEK